VGKVCSCNIRVNPEEEKAVGANCKKKSLLRGGEAWSGKRGGGLSGRTEGGWASEERMD